MTGDPSENSQLEEFARKILALKQRLVQENEARMRLIEERDRRASQDEPRRLTVDQLAMRRGRAPSRDLEAACHILAAEPRDIIRRRIYERNEQLTEDDAAEWVREWLLAVDEAITEYPDAAQVLHDHIGPRWHIMCASAKAGMCDDPRCWRHLVEFLSPDPVIADALWVAWETVQSDSNDRIILTKW